MDGHGFVADTLFVVDMLVVLPTKELKSIFAKIEMVLICSSNREFEFGLTLFGPPISISD